MFRTSVFKGTLTGTLYGKTGRHTSSGEAVFELLGPILYTPIRSEKQLEPTSIRADKSGSKSRAEELVFKGRIQVAPTPMAVNIKNGSKLAVLGSTYKVMDVAPIHNVMDSTIDHYLVDLGL
jgi:hypothetical protein